MYVLLYNTTKTIPRGTKYDDYPLVFDRKCKIELKELRT